MRLPVEREREQMRKSKYGFLFPFFFNFALFNIFPRFILPFFFQFLFYFPFLVIHLYKSSRKIIESLGLIIIFHLIVIVTHKS